MSINTDEEIRLRCLEQARLDGPKRVIARARAYYNFVKGDQQKRPIPQPLPNFSHEAEARRVAPLIRPT